MLGLLLLLTFLFYTNSLANGFVYDDHSQIEHNPYVQNLGNVAKLFSTSVMAYQGKGKQGIRNYYRPVSSLEALLCYELFGLFAPGFHLISLLMHCFVVGLVCAASTELTSDYVFGLIAAACFALHPIHTEPVDWIAASVDLEMTLFYLLAFWLFLRLGRAGGQRQRWLVPVMLTSFLAAVLSKETAITLPLVATVYEHFFREGRAESGWRTKLARYGGFWVIALIYLLARQLVLGGQVPKGLHADIGTSETAVTALNLAGRYFTKLVWPTPLVAFYPFRKITSALDPWALVGAAAAVAAIAYVAWRWKRSPVYCFALLWMFSTIALVLNVHWLTANVFAERYLYLPSVGFSRIVAGLFLWCWRKTDRATNARRLSLGVAAAVLLSACVSTTLARSRDWKHDGSIAVGTLRTYPEASYLRSNVALGEWHDGNHAEALHQLQLALSYSPDAPEPPATMGIVLFEQSKYAEAIPWLERAIALKSDFVLPHVYLARVYSEMKESAEAETEFTRAVEIAPLDSSVRNSFGEFYLSEGRPRDAQTEFLATASTDPSKDGWLGLAQADTLLGDSQNAGEAWQRVLAFDPFDSRAHLAVARIYLAAGRTREASKEFEQCLLMDPHNKEALAEEKNLQVNANARPSGARP